MSLNCLQCNKSDASVRSTGLCQEHSRLLGPRRSVRGNPTKLPPLPPGSPYPCEPREAKQWLGKKIAGRGGGTVIGCATPSRKRPKERLLVLSSGTKMRKKSAWNRLRFSGKIRKDDLLDVATAAARIASTGIPEPTGLEFPHRSGSSPCVREHPLWGERYESALETVMERLAIKHPKMSEQKLNALIRKEMEKIDKSWVMTADQCSRAFADREKRRRGKAVEGAQRERARARQAFVARGGDVGAAEYKDDVLRPLGGARRARKNPRKSSGLRLPGMEKPKSKSSRKPRAMPNPPKWMQEYKAGDRIEYDDMYRWVPGTVEQLIYINRHWSIQFRLDNGNRQWTKMKKFIRKV